MRVEELEARVVPYATTGNAWPHPQLITISFVPDGTLIAYNQSGPIYSTLFRDFNALWSQSTWQKQFLLAAQSWADATNINFSVVSDSGVQIGQITGYNQQGDPNVGDIRIAGFQDTGGTYLAQAYQPPPANNYSLAGDMWFNTSQSFHIGVTYDLYTVAAHEIGHALGMDHSSDPTVTMAPSYPGTTTALASDDIAGIQSIYSAGATRSYDTYNNAGTHNNSLANAASFTVDPGALTAQLTNLDITTAGMNEYFKFVAPSGSSTLHLSIQSSGLSLLAPRVWVYNSSYGQIGYKSGASTYGATLNLTVNSLVGGNTYYIKVNGAESTALGTGLYALSLSTGSNPVPTVSLPNTLTPNGNPIQSGGSLPEGAFDRYEVPSQSQRTGETIDGRLPSTNAPAISVPAVGPGRVTDGSSWVNHDSQAALPAPHAQIIADHVWQSVAQDAQDDGAPWDAAMIAPLFPGESHEQVTSRGDTTPGDSVREDRAERITSADPGQAAAACDASVTQSGLPGDMPILIVPEQGNDDALHQATELLSLGSVVWVICAGTPALTAGARQETERRCPAPGRRER